MDLRLNSASLGALQAFHSSSMFLIYRVIDSQNLINSYEILVYIEGFTSTFFMKDLIND